MVKLLPTNNIHCLWLSRSASSCCIWPTIENNELSSGKWYRGRQNLFEISNFFYQVVLLRDQGITPGNTTIQYTDATLEWQDTLFGAKYEELVAKLRSSKNNSKALQKQSKDSKSSTKNRPKRESFPWGPLSQIRINRGRRLFETAGYSNIQGS